MDENEGKKKAAGWGIAREPSLDVFHISIGQIESSPYVKWCRSSVIWWIIKNPDHGFKKKKKTTWILKKKTDLGFLKKIFGSGRGMPAAPVLDEGTLSFYIFNFHPSKKKVI